MGGRDRPRVRASRRSRGTRRDRGRRARRPRPGPRGGPGAGGRRGRFRVRPRAGPRRGVRRSRPAHRQARAHAAVAAALDHRLGRATEAARHWLAAGPAHAARAWRAAEEAAAEARAGATPTSPPPGCSSAPALDRPRRRPGEHRRGPLPPADGAGRCPPLAGCVGAVGRRRARRARGGAAGSTTYASVARAASDLRARRSVWQTAGYAEVNTALVDALRDVLDQAARHRRRAALPGDARAGRRSSTTPLRSPSALALMRGGTRDGATDRRPSSSSSSAGESAFVACWTTATKELRLSWATEALATASGSAPSAALVTAATQRAVVLSRAWSQAEMDRGDPPGEGGDRPAAPRLRPCWCVEALQLSWDAMRGDFEARRGGLRGRGGRSHGRVPVPQRGLRPGRCSRLHPDLWQDRRAEVLPLFEMLGPGPMPITSIYLLTMLRGGARRPGPPRLTRSSRSICPATTGTPPSTGPGPPRLRSASATRSSARRRTPFSSRTPGTRSAPAPAWPSARSTPSSPAPQQRRATATRPPATPTPLWGSSSSGGFPCAASGSRGYAASTTSRTSLTWALLPLDLGLTAPGARPAPTRPRTSRRPGSPRSSSSGPST